MDFCSRDVRMRLDGYCARGHADISYAIVFIARIRSVAQPPRHLGHRFPTRVLLHKEFHL